MQRPDGAGPSAARVQRFAWWLPWIALTGLGTLGVVVAWTIARTEEMATRTRFDRAVADLRFAIDDRLSAAGDMVRDLAALVAASESVSQDELRAFVQFGGRADRPGVRAQFCLRAAGGVLVTDPPLGPGATPGELALAADPRIAELAARASGSGGPEVAAFGATGVMVLVIAHPVPDRGIVAVGAFDAPSVLGGARVRSAQRGLEYRVGGPGGQELYATRAWAEEPALAAVGESSALGVPLSLRVTAPHGTEYDHVPVVPWFVLGAGIVLGAGAFRSIRGLVRDRERADAEKRAERQAADLVRAREELARQTAEYYRVLFDDAPEPMWLYDESDFRFTAVNRAAVRAYGWTADEFLAKTILDIRPAEDAARLRALVQAGLPDENSQQATHITRDGRHLDVVVSTRRLRLGGRVLRAVAVRDVTQQVRLESQFRQAQKMEAVGLLAGGVAHDFNNLLSVVLGYSEMLRRAVPPGAARDQLTEIVSASERASELTRKLLTFSRTQEVRLRPVDAVALVRGLGKMARRLVPETIEVRMDLAGGMPCVVADPGGLEQAMLNVVVNASDAMPCGGVLTLRTSVVPAAAIPGRLMSPPPAGDRVAVISISDTGTGMDAATIERIFEPFFTTKPVGRGTGLGLSTVYGIVRKLGGGIAVDSSPGHGASFHIALAVTDEPAEEVSDSAEAWESAISQPLRVLVAEDHDGVRDVLYQILQRAGHRVLAASSGEQALAIATTETEPLDVVVADVVMPGMDGPELVRRIRALHPEVRAVYVSGHPDDVVRDRVPVEAGANLLRKPVDSRALLHAVVGESPAPA